MSNNTLRREKDYTCKGLVQLSAGQSYEGKINYIIVSNDCEFPDNTTEVTTDRGGINLNGYVATFGVSMIPCEFRKVTISAGNALLGIE